MIKMIRNFLYFLAASFLVLGTVSCSEKIDTGTDISGQWHLTDTGGLIEDQNMAIDVYISFDSGNFSLYQKVGEDLLRYWYYDGTYSVFSEKSACVVDNLCFLWYVIKTKERGSA